MASFIDKLPPQVQALRNVNVPPQIKAAHGKVQYYVDKIDKELEQYPTLVKLEQTGKVNKAWGAIGLFCLIATAIFFNLAAGFLTCVLGVGLPAYLSLVSLETPDTKDDQQWLTYWAAFGAFTLLEPVSGLLVHYFRFYYTFKAVLLLWLMLPQTKGAKLVYMKLLRPVFFRGNPAALQE